MSDLGALCDLHTHSTVSDGTFSPAELARAAYAAGLKACALTDHDNTDGLDEFLSECAKLGIESIAGVELSAQSDDDLQGEIHIVGLFIDYRDEYFNSELSKLRNVRTRRNYAMLEKCRENGFEISEAELLAQKADGDMDGVGRPHFAAVFVSKGYAKDINEAFDLYLGKGKPCYCDRELFSPERCIELILKAGGVPVLAHPRSVSKGAFAGDWKTGIPKAAKRLKMAGLIGMECMHSDNTPEIEKFSFRVCAEEGLLPSGGTDFHGANKEGNSIGIGHGEMAVPYEFVINLKKARSINSEQ